MRIETGVGVKYVSFKGGDIMLSRIAEWQLFLYPRAPRRHENIEDSIIIDHHASRGFGG